MKTVVLDPLPVELEELIERRKRLGQDCYDEIWEGVYHMAPMARFGHGFLDQQLAELLGPLADAAGLTPTGAFNLGEPNDFRVPDRGIHRGHPDPGAVFLSTAAVVIEILSPGDESYDKLPFYAAHGVDEVMLVDPGERRIRVLVLGSGRYQEAESSALLRIQASDLTTAIRWP